MFIEIYIIQDTGTPFAGCIFNDVYNLFHRDSKLDPIANAGLLHKVAPMIGHVVCNINGNIVYPDYLKRSIDLILSKYRGLGSFIIYAWSVIDGGVIDQALCKNTGSSFFPNEYILTNQDYKNRCINYISDLKWLSNYLNSNASGNLIPRIHPIPLPLTKKF